MGLTKEQLLQVKKPVQEGNRRSVIAWSACAILFWAMSLVLAFKQDAYASCRMVYLAATVLCLVTLTGSAFLAKRYSWMQSMFMYLLELTIMGAGIGIAICQPDVRTVTIIAFAIILPTCVIDRTFMDIIMLIVTAVIYALLARNYVEPDIFSWELTNLVIFSVAGVLIGHVINKARFQRYVQAEKARKLTEMLTRYAYFDQLTQLRNRLAYVEKMESYKKEIPQELCVVMADLNGLKVMNDTYGHEAGDELIIGAAKCLNEAFGGIDTIYRIGGDEFCILMNASYEEVMKCLKRLDEVSAKWKGNHIDGVSVSYGVATNKDASEIEAIIRKADRRMYVNKRNYYGNNETE